MQLVVARWRRPTMLCSMSSAAHHSPRRTIYIRLIRILLESQKSCLRSDEFLITLDNKGFSTLNLLLWKHYYGDVCSRFAIRLYTIRRNVLSPWNGLSIKSWMVSDYLSCITPPICIRSYSSLELQNTLRIFLVGRKAFHQVSGSHPIFYQHRKGVYKKKLIVCSVSMLNAKPRLRSGVMRLPTSSAFTRILSVTSNKTKLLQHMILAVIREAEKWDVIVVQCFWLNLFRTYDLDSQWGKKQKN